MQIISITNYSQNKFANAKFLNSNSGVNLPFTSQNYELDFEDISLLDDKNNHTNSKTKNRRPHMVDDHISVLLNETIDGLNPQDGKIYVDCTFGAGGHTKAILERANCKVIAIDRDPHTKIYADYYKKFYGDRLTYVSGKFSELAEHLKTLGIKKVDGILMDIGVSSMQIDTPRRGFSFQNDGPLDMRMGEGMVENSGEGRDAFQLVNFAAEEELAGIIYKYGDERRSRAIARAVVNYRLSNGEISRTLQLAEIIKKAVGRYDDTIHPATRTFQAIRIWVNDELGELEQALEASAQALAKDGVLAVITFHSGEDVIVKNFINEKCGKQKETFSRYSPMSLNEVVKPASFQAISKKAIAPSEAEIKNNYRARSAKLRLARKIIL
jgi:16S rRNA (cytosine1402-N4)-methyltransferase